MISAWCDDIIRRRRGPSTTEVVEHFEMLIDIEQMRKALDGVTLSLKIREKEERENEIKGEVGPTPTKVPARGGGGFGWGRGGRLGRGPGRGGRRN